LYGAEAGVVGKFAVHVHDINANSMARGGTPVTASISNDDSLYYLKVRDHEDGTYSAHYIMCKPGVYQLNIRLNDEHEIFGSPFELNIMPSKTVPEQCIAEGEALKFIHPSTLSSFTIIARDIFGNSKTRGGEPFEVGVMGPATMKSLRDNGNGTYTCFFEAMNLADLNYLTGASVMLMVTLFGKPIQGSPFCPTILDAPLNSSVRSNLNSTSSRVAASGLVNNAVTPVKAPGSSVASVNDSVNDEKSSVHSGRMSKSELLMATAPDNAPSAKSAEGRVSSLQSKSGFDPTANTAGLSKLERARQRAIMAKSLNENGGVGESKSGHSSLPYNSLVAPPPPPPPLPYDASSGSLPPDLTMRLNKLEALNKAVNSISSPGTGGASRLQSLGARLEAAKLSTTRPLTAAVSTGPDFGSGSPSKKSPNSHLSFDPISVAANIRMGLVGPQPPTLTSEEVAMWGTVHRALTMPEVVNQVVPHLQCLKGSFDWVSEEIEGSRVVRLTNSAGGGMARLLESYDIIPAYLTKKEAKMAFFVILSSQRNAGNVPAAAGSVGLEFSSFVKLLLLVCIHSLSKTSTFSSLYSTTEVRDSGQS
jgi:hypothetical protein